MNKTDRINVRLEKPTWERLTEMGKKRETFDEIINRLLDFYESYHPSIINKKTKEKVEVVKEKK